MGKIIIANDHSSVELKKRIASWLTSKGYEVVNVGTDIEESVDYPDMAETACKLFLEGGYDFGILFCGTGIGISISANKIKGIRCALIHDAYSAKMSKLHNDANFIAFGGRVEYNESIETMIEAYCSTSFEGGRHKRRVDKMNSLDDK